ncbi:MAG: HEPN domain-containing protein [Syntrophobacteraceae bacterium]
MGKRTRDIVGYTHQKQLASADLWYKRSLSFYEAANILSKSSSKFSEPSDAYKHFLYNAALSFELIFKAILVARGMPVKPTHRLRELAEIAEVKLDDDQTHTLVLLTEYITWVARYPAPKKEGEWDNFHDGIFPMHMIESASGNTSMVMAHPKRFPSVQNCKKIWDICLSKYRSIEDKP